MRNAKIVCTLGPATDDEASVRALADAGMTVARINASHGGPADRRALVETARTVDDQTEKPLAVMLDTQGPEVRTAETDDEVHIVEGSEVAFAEGETTTVERVGLSTSIAAAEPRDRVLLDDGRIEAVVDRVEGETVTPTWCPAGASVAGRA